jgi:hypothetical protein
MLSVGFEPTISVGERPQTYVLGRAATEIGILVRLPIKERSGGQGVYWTCEIIESTYILAENLKGNEQFEDFGTDKWFQVSGVWSVVTCFSDRRFGRIDIHHRVGWIGI